MRHDPTNLHPIEDAVLRRLDAERCRGCAWRGTSRCRDCHRDDALSLKAALDALPDACPEPI